MTPELGVFFLILALLMALLQASYLVTAGSVRLFVASCLPQASWLQALFITLAFAVLMTLRLDSDFSVESVIEHSNLSLPTLYKIAGTWGNHEGSMVLWVWVLAMFGALLYGSRTTEDTSLKQMAVAVQSFVGAGFLLFILFTSNPFVRHFPPMQDGQALNPLLQDIALSMHPPLLYLGYVGFSIVFSLAVAALWQGRMDKNWAEVTHPWILVSWSSLTIGIGLGSWWAYRVLGWGGWWFWDPVENASLLPWLCGTALLHSNIVLKKRGIMKPWVLLLSIITFGLSMLGTFLVRSGVIISVHSFASDPTRGFFILMYMVLVLGGALLLFALRAGKIQSQDEIVPVSREGMIVINNLFLLTACATVLLGTIYPMLAEMMTGDKITVGGPYYTITFLPLVAVPLVFTGLTPFMPWKNASFAKAFAEAKIALMVTGAGIVLILAMVDNHRLLTMIGFGLSLWLAASSVQWLLKRHASQGSTGVFFAHAGVAVIIAGITGASLWQAETESSMKPGESIDLAGYHLTLKQVEDITAPNYKARRGQFIVSDASGELGVLAPEYRTYDIRKSSTSEAAIYYTFTSDLYVVIGESDKGRTAVRVYYKPMIHLIWGGFVLMALGGFVALLTQRKKSS